MPLLLIGGSCVTLAVMLTRQQQQQKSKEAAEARAGEQQKQRPEERIEDYLTVDPMDIREIEILETIKEGVTVYQR